MPDPLVALIQQRWQEYCVNPSTHSYTSFTHLFSESAVQSGCLTDSELSKLLATFPEGREIARRVRFCLNRRQGGVTLVVDDERVRLARAHTAEMERLARENGMDQIAAQLAAVSDVAVIDRSEFDLDPYQEGPADILTDEFWDSVIQEIVDTVPSAYGLKEACWGITADRTVSYYILEPLLGRNLGLSHYAELWRLDSRLGISSGGLVVSR